MMVGARGGGRRELKGVEGMKWWWLRGRILTRGGIMQVKECGADVNAASNDGTTAVMAAANGGHTATVVALVRAGWCLISILNRKQNYSDRLAELQQ